jgi:hypothetical protein
MTFPVHYELRGRGEKFTVLKTIFLGGLNLGERER